MDITFDIVEELAVLSERNGGWSKEFNIISWNGRSPKFDIRDWDSKHEKMGKGITLSREEAYELHLTLLKIFGRSHGGGIPTDILDIAKD